MSHIDVLADLEDLLADLPAAIDSRRLGHGLTRAMAMLRTSDRLIERIDALFKLTSEIGFSDTDAQAKMVDEVRETAIVVGEDLQNAATAADFDKAVSYYERELTKAVNRLDLSMGQHWRSVVHREFEPLLSIGNLLDRINPASDLGKHLSACGAEARFTPDGLGGRQLLDRARKLLHERERLQARRREELGDGDIADFVNALADDRATLAMVTPAVSSWLSENHALDKLKIKPGA